MSKTTAEVLDSASRQVEPFMRIPLLDAPPIPEKKESGTEITRAQGQEITRKMRARLTHEAKG